jgi:hypothetical protein
MEKTLLLRVQRKYGPAETMISGFRPQELGKNNFF